MVDTRIVKDATDSLDLCETYSTDGYKLMQVETGKIYGSSVIDIIKGLDGDKPFSPYTYEETDELEIIFDEFGNPLGTEYDEFGNIITEEINELNISEIE